MAAPLNIVHISAADIAADRIHHIKQTELDSIASQGRALSAVSFQDSIVISAATSLGTYLTFKHEGIEYALQLYEI